MKMEMKSIKNNFKVKKNIFNYIKNIQFNKNNKI